LRIFKIKTNNVADKAASKYDMSRESEARIWIQAVLKQDISEGSFMEVLKSGVVLCNLINAVTKSNIKPSPSSMPFKQMENISLFLKEMSQLGVPTHEVFQTIDLFEFKNPNQVLDSIYSLSRHASKKGYEGPVLGPKLGDKHIVNFSNEQLNQGKHVVGLLMKGSPGANASGVTYGSRREIGGSYPNLNRQ
jgi:hypothetical protein